MRFRFAFVEHFSWRNLPAHQAEIDKAPTSRDLHLICASCESAPHARARLRRVGFFGSKSGKGLRISLHPQC